jgi:integral membrane protein
MIRDGKFLSLLRRFSLVEGVSTLLLFFVAMPLKYVFDLPMAVTIVGSLHGLLFLSVVTLFLIGMERIPLSIGLVCRGIAGAVVPFGPFLVDRSLRSLEARG